MKRLVLTLALPVLALPTFAANWGNWRGPNFDGSSPETGLPATFGPDEKLVWKAPLPGPSGSTPAVWGDRVFVASADSVAKTVVAIAMDRKTGRELWRRKVSDGLSKDNMSTFSNASPVTDGEKVWFFSGTGDLVCFDVEGREVWRRNIQNDYGQFAFLWTFSTSPVLFEGRLYLQVLQRDTPVGGRGRKDGPNDSYILALDPATGRELWKVIRPARAKDESLESFTTPTPISHDGGKELLVAGGDCITGHDTATGRELWRWGTWNPTQIGHWRLVPSPVSGGGVALACGPKGAPVYAVKLGNRGTLTHSGLAWQSYIQRTETAAEAGRSLENKDLTTDVPTPLFYQGRFYVLNGNSQQLLCVEPASGKVLWTGSVKGRMKFEASPTGADGKVFLMNHAGEVFVVDAAPGEFRLLHKTSFAEGTENSLRASVVPAQGHLFIRTSKQLFCLGH